MAQYWQDAKRWIATPVIVAIVMKRETERQLDVLFLKPDAAEPVQTTLHIVDVSGVELWMRYS